MVFITDSYAHRLWVHEGTDLFLTTSADRARSIEGFLPRARVAVVTASDPAGVLRRADQGRRQSGARRSGRRPLRTAHVGRVGHRTARRVADRARPRRDLGARRRRQQRTPRPAAARRRARAADPVPFGFTDRVPELMAASDAVISSSGDTCREARVVGRGLVLVDVVPGHGRENLMHELELGGAVVTTTAAADDRGRGRGVPRRSARR